MSNVLLMSKIQTITVPYIVGIQRRRVNRNIAPVSDLLNERCNVCNQTYKALSSYRFHMSRCLNIKFPSAEVLSIYVHRNETSVTDEIGKRRTACDKVYRNKTAYKIHLCMIHGIVLPRLTNRAIQINRDIIPDRDDENNYCASCNRTYSNRSNYSYVNYFNDPGVYSVLLYKNPAFNKLLYLLQHDQVVTVSQNLWFKKHHPIVF
ncbi:hypothetical protein BDF21DRAFT_400506 [Thamnidium elegans]|nr:hypothetical protein BDF21DRAFT_400506 [Thamnidium elegans]